MRGSVGALDYLLTTFGVPEGWEEARVGDLAKIVGGGTPDRENPAFWRDGTIPWVTPTDITLQNRKYLTATTERISEAGYRSSNVELLPPGTIVFSTRGTIGAMAIAGVPLTTNQSCESLIPEPGVDSEFLYYFLHFLKPMFLRLGAGTTFLAITRDDIVKVRYAIPNLEGEQKIVARVLGAVDASIERTRAVIEKAHRLRRGLIEHFLHKGVRGESLKDSPVGRIPCSWDCPRLGTLIEDGPTNGLYRPDSDYGKDGTPIVRIDSFDGGIIHSLGCLRRVRLSEIEVRRYALKRGDILINRVNSMSHIGKSAIVPTLDETCVFESNMMRLTLNPQLLPQFFILVLCSNIARAQWLARARPAVNQASINQKDVRQMWLPKPDPAEQQQIVDLVGCADQLRANLEMELRAYERIKRGLMQDLLTGKVRVRPEPVAVAAAQKDAAP